MTKKAATIFERAARAVQDGDAKTCRGLIGELEALVREERDELERIRPPGQAARYTGDGATIMAPTLAGPDYQAAIRAEDMERVEALERRHRVLTARLAEAGTLLSALRERRKVATETEAKAAAPARLAKLQKDLPALLDRSEAALAEVRASLGDCGAWLRSAQEQRALAGEDGPVVEPEPLFRLGRVLRHTLAESKTWRVGGVGTNEKDIPALFSSPEQLAQAERLLGEPEVALLDRLRRFLFGSDPVPASQAGRESAAFHRARRALLARGALDAASDPSQVQAEVVRASSGGSSARREERVEHFRTAG